VYEDGQAAVRQREIGRAGKASRLPLKFQAQLSKEATNGAFGARVRRFDARHDGASLGPRESLRHQ
jgi:hypothetical protein